VREIEKGARNRKREKDEKRESDTEREEAGPLGMPFF